MTTWCRGVSLIGIWTLNGSKSEFDLEFRFQSSSSWGFGRSLRCFEKKCVCFPSNNQSRQKMQFAFPCFLLGCHHYTSASFSLTPSPPSSTPLYPILPSWIFFFFFPECAHTRHPHPHTFSELVFTPSLPHCVGLERNRGARREDLLNRGERPTGGEGPWLLSRSCWSPG